MKPPSHTTTTTQTPETLDPAIQGESPPLAALQGGDDRRLDGDGAARRGRAFSLRYMLEDRLAEGGSSVVHRALDRTLQRTVAVKILREDLARREEKRARFLVEARLCARLSHPSILTVFDWGLLPDGRPYIIMPEINGETLQTRLRQLRPDPARPLELAPLRGLIDILHAVSAAMAYAHTQGVLHRDLKPENIMIGAFGEVYIMDWGLGVLREDAPIAPHLRRHREDAGAETPEEREEAETWRAMESLGQQSHTREGRVRGTIPYISPEQARGQNRALDARTDVFALGAILFKILTGQPPWGRGTERTMLERAREGRSLEVPPSPHIPERVREICLKAVALDPAERFADAAALADALKGWLDRQDDILRAQALLGQAAETLALLAPLEAQADALEEQALGRLDAMPETADEADKHESWRQQDEARRLRREAQRLHAERMQILHNALSFDPENHEAHTLLAEQYVSAHRIAETRGDTVAADQLLFQLHHHNRGTYSAYLRPEGALTLLTDPPGATVQLFTYQEQHRRLHPVPFGAPQPCPLLEHPLPIGSYLAEIHAPGRQVVRLPFTIARAQITHGAMHPQDAPHPCWLPPLGGDAGGELAYIPAGPFWSGGDPDAYGSPLPLRRLWVDGFWIARHPTTNAQYLAFLNDLIATGREEEARRCCPGRRPGQSAYTRDTDGRFVLAADADGDIWQPSWPVVMLSFAAIQGYIAWKRGQTGQDLRLPYELEWEKVARGADTRTHVWGTDAFEPSWCRCRLSTARSPAPVGTYPADTSVYGVHDLAGNVADRCQDAYRTRGPLIDAQGRWQPLDQPTGRHTARGGHWGGNNTQSRLCARGGIEDSQRPATVGFRLVAPAPAPGLRAPLEEAPPAR